MRKIQNTPFMNCRVFLAFIHVCPFLQWCEVLSFSKHCCLYRAGAFLYSFSASRTFLFLSYHILLTTRSTVADCSIAEALITEFQAEYLLANRGYDTDAIISSALQAGMMPVIPPKKNRKVPRNYDSIITSCDTSSRMLFSAQETARHCYALF